MNFHSNNLNESNDFLNAVLDNINSAVVILDKDAKIKECNDAFKVLFCKEEDNIIQNPLGNTLGCIFAENENVDCGETSNCGSCILRKNINNVFTEKVPAFKEIIIREFKIENKIYLKHLQFTTKYINYNNEQMVLIIIEDITDIIEKNILLERMNNQKNEF